MYVPAWPSLNPSYLFKRPLQQDLPFPLHKADSQYYYVARNGIYQLFRQLALAADDVVLVPDYHHGNEIAAIQAAGVKLNYYPVKANMDIDLDALSTLCNAHTRVLYVTHFIGWPQPMRELQAFCRQRGLLLVEDCALAFLCETEGRPLGSFGDYAVFCLYKWVPVPNGGVLIKNEEGAGPSLKTVQLRDPGGLSVGARSSELIVQWIRFHHQRTGQALLNLKRFAGRTLSAARVKRTPVGDNRFEIKNADMAMSAVCHHLLRRFDYAEIHRLRRRNFLYLTEKLRGAARPVREDLPEGACPLFFPLLVGDKHAAAQHLERHGIEAVEFWNDEYPDTTAPDSAAAWLRKHVLEVPISQEVSLAQLDIIAKHILELNDNIPDFSATEQPNSVAAVAG